MTTHLRVRFEHPSPRLLDRRAGVGPLPRLRAALERAWSTRSSTRRSSDSRVPRRARSCAPASPRTRASTSACHPCADAPLAAGRTRRSSSRSSALASPGDGGRRRSSPSSGRRALAAVRRTGGSRSSSRPVAGCARWLAPVTPSAYLRESPPTEKLYIPSRTARRAVAEWSLTRGEAAGLARGAPGRSRARGNRQVSLGRALPAVLHALPRERADVREDDAHPRAREPAARGPVQEEGRPERAVEGPEPPRLLVRRARAGCTRTRSARPCTGR